MTKFSKEVTNRLGFYVYRLIDPRSGNTFYVGKGKGNRVFDHIKGDVNQSDEGMPDKLATIRDIRNAGLEVTHVIHRHGLDEKTAMEVESALMDAYPGLTNIASGHGSSERGAMHATEIIEKFEAEEAVFQHSGVIVIVSNSTDERSVYSAARYAWKLSPSKVREVDYVFAVRHGVIVGVFRAEQWLLSDDEAFADFEQIEGRIGFVGRPAPEDVRKMYLRKRVPGQIAYTTKYVSPQSP